MKTKNETSPHCMMSFRTTEAEKTELEKLAIKQHISVSSLIREYVSKWIGIDSSKEDIDFIRGQIREELSMQLKPAIERIVKLTVKSGIVSAAGYFLNASALEELVHPARQAIISSYLPTLSP